MVKRMLHCPWHRVLRSRVNSLILPPVTPFRPFTETFEARFIARPNRFLVECERNGEILQAYLPNPGRLQELLLPGQMLYLTREGTHALRKNAFTVVAVMREDHPVMLHTHRTNNVARYLIEQGKVPGLEGATVVRPEITTAGSRFDFLLNHEGRDMFLEVKSCTLVGRRVAMFPDAVTARGARHLEELGKIASEGTHTGVLFVVHWPHARFFMPDYHTDLHFAETLLAVREKITVIPLAVEWGSDLSLSDKVRLLEIPWGYVEEEARDRGSYILILRLPRDETIDVGGLGPITFTKGFYMYVGSAMANLSKRMERHRRLEKKYHWHIDFLRARAELVTVLAIRSSVRLECEIARAMAQLSEWSVPGFGSSDCSCTSHLFAMDSNPFHSELFQAVVQHFRMDRFSS